MRHARSPPQAPALDTASKDNPALERELDDVGKATATAMGEALRGLRIRVGKVYSSPTFRAMGEGMNDGELLVARPGAEGSHTVVGRIPIERWPELLAAERSAGAAR
jgi:hypothetical protein